MPLKLALAVRETVAGHRLGALEEGGRGTSPRSNASLPEASCQSSLGALQQVLQVIDMVQCGRTRAALKQEKGQQVWCSKKERLCDAKLKSTALMAVTSLTPSASTV